MINIKTYLFAILAILFSCKDDCPENKEIIQISSTMNPDSIFFEPKELIFTREIIDSTSFKPGAPTIYFYNTGFVNIDIDSLFIEISHKDELSILKYPILKGGILYVDIHTDTDIYPCVEDYKIHGLDWKYLNNKKIRSCYYNEIIQCGD